jgi:hypothetical protein
VLCMEGNCITTREQHSSQGVWPAWVRAMVAASKYVRFNELCSELECKDLYHSWTPSCLASAWDMSQRSMKGSIQFFTSMYVVSHFPLLESIIGTHRLFDGF